MIYKNKTFLSFKKMVSAIVLSSVLLTVQGQHRSEKMLGVKKISPDLFGLFFEDINYAADGGLYAEQVQNRSFEYNPAERREWHPLSFWEYITPGFSYGKISVESAAPINPNNPHYVVLEAEHIGNEKDYKGESGVGIRNTGFAGMVVKDGDQYLVSFFCAANL